MMWIGLLLILFHGTLVYDYQVIALNRQGCHVYNQFFISCLVTPPPGAIPIPPDAIEVFAQRQQPRTAK